MPKPIRPAKYSDRWFGAGAAGRWVGRGYYQQSPLPAPRSDFDWIDAYSQYGLRNALERRGVSFDRPVQTEADAQAQAQAQGQTIERLSDTPIDPRQMRENLLGMDVSSGDFQYLSPAQVGTLPAVKLTGSYADPTDFTNLPAHSAGWERMTPTEQTLATALGSDTAAEIFSHVEVLNAAFDAAGKVPVIGAPVRFLGWGFNNLMQFLDTGAEGAERILGTAYQMANDEELQQALTSEGSLMGLSAYERSRLGQAWQAASLFYDTIAPPTGLFVDALGNIKDISTPDEGTGVPGMLAKLAGLSAPMAIWEAFNATPEEWQQLKNDWNSLYPRVVQHWKQVLAGEPVEVGGLPALVAARNALSEGATLEEVRSRFTEDLDILAIRSQTFDAGLHILADPLNFIMPKLKPVENIRAMTTWLRYNRVDPHITDAADLMRRIVNGTQVYPTFEERMADLVRTAETIGNDELTAAARIMQTGEGQEFTQAMDTVTRITDALAETGRMSRGERLVLGILGGVDPFDPHAVDLTEKLGQGVTDIASRLRIARLDDTGRWIIRPSLLTARSRATTFIQNVSDNTRILLGNANLRPEDIVRVIKQGAAGAFGGKFGHMFVVPSGRHIQEVLRRYAQSADEMLNIWNMTSGARETATRAARLMGMDLVTFMGRLQDGKKGVQSTWDEFVTMLRNVPNPTEETKTILGMIDDGSVTKKLFADVAVALSKTKDGRIIPYTDDMFRAVMTTEIVEQAARVGVGMYGVHMEGWLEKLANGVRGVESLLLLGLNPKYPVQNWWNNDITMIARGIYNRMTPEMIENLWRNGYGFMPTRLNESFGTIGGSLTEMLARGNIDESARAGYQILNDAIHTPGTGLDKFNDFVRAKLPGVIRGKDMRTWAAAIEKTARARAYTAGMLKAWDTVWRPGIGFTMMDDLIPGFSDELRAVDPELADLIVDVVSNAKKPDDLNVILRGLTDWRLNYETLVRKAGEQSGLGPDTIRHWLDSELGEVVRRGLQDLKDNPGVDDINRIFDDVDQSVQQHLDDLAEQSAPLRFAEAETIMQAEGPQALGDLWASITTRIFERHVDHFAALDIGIGNVNRTPVGFQRLAWDNLLEHGQRDWDRVWKVTRATLDGMASGLKKAGVSDDVTRIMTESWDVLKKNTEAFFTYRNDTWKKFWNTDWSQTAQGARNTRYHEIIADLDRRYTTLMNSQLGAWSRLDNAFVRLTETPTTGLPLFQGGEPNQIAEAVRNWRSMLRDMRRNDMLEVQRFRLTLESMNRTQREAAWMGFNQQRGPRLAEIARLEVAGRDIFSGNPDALAYFLNLDAPADDIRLVDIMISSLDDVELYRNAYRQADSVPGLRRLLDNIALEENPEEALKALRETYRSEQMARMIDDAAALFVGDKFTPALEKVVRAFGMDPRAEGEAVDAMMDMFGRGEFAPELDAVKKAINVTEETATINGVNVPKITVSFGDETFQIGTVDGKEWTLALPDGTVLNTSSMPDAQEFLTQQARDIIELNARNSWLRDTFGTRAEELNRLSDFLDRPTKDIDPELRNLLQDTANEMWSELQGAGPGGVKARDLRTVASDENVARSRVPLPWYNDLTDQHRELVGARRTFENALESIRDGTEYTSAGLPRSKWVAVAKQAILDNIRRLSDQYPDALWDLIKIRDVPRTYLSPVKPPERYNIGDYIRMYQSVSKKTGQQFPPNLFESLFGVNPSRTGDRAEYINRLEQMVPREQFLGDGLDELFTRYQRGMLELLRDQAHRIRQTPPPEMMRLPPPVMKKLLRYTDHVSGQLNDARLTAAKIAEGISDGALLNYSKQYHWDAWLSYIAPYGYWYTHSVAAWLAHSIDRPAMFGTYYKMKRYLDEVVGDQQGLPQRLKGKIRINLPFVPDWMGDWYIDPLRMFGLPLEGFTQPWEQLGRATLADQQGTLRILDELLRNRQLTQEQYDQAKETMEGPYWEMAMGIARERYAENEFDMYDFMSLSVSPHLPLQWLWNIKEGTPENITPLPITRTAKAVSDLIGIPPGLYNNTWANVRQWFGLPGFDKWDDYRIDRELSTMVAEGRMTVQQAITAMIERGNNPLFLEASQRVDRTTGFRYLLGLTGLPLTNYPAGEREMRELQDDFNRAMDANEAGHPEVLAAFFDQHPEYEARLALWDEPEDRLRKFLWDQVTETYYNLSSLDRHTVRETLGDAFSDNFFDRDTYAPEDVSPEVLGTWLKMMGGDAPGTLGDGALPIELAPPEIAARAQVFYDFRNQYFPNWFELQDQYGKLDANEERSAFLETHPELEAYWKWRDEVLPNHAELMDAYFSLAEDSARDLFLQDFPELAAMWAKAEEIFPDHSVLAQQYSLTPDYMKDDFRAAHPELVAYWQWRDQTLPHWEMYYDYYFTLSPDSQRDLYLDQHPELISFWNARSEEFPGIEDISKLYNQLPQSDARSEFLAAHPELSQYWDWRNSFLRDNPDVVPYIDDEFTPNYGSEQELNAAIQNAPQYTWQEWSTQLSIPLQEMLLDYMMDGIPLPDAAEDQLGDLADVMGMDYQDLLLSIQQSVSP